MMAIRVPEAVCASGILFCVHCEDPQTAFFQKAKFNISDVETEEYTFVDEPFLMDQFSCNDWYPFSKINVIQDVQDGHKAAGVGTNKMKYQRAVALALFVTREVLAGRDLGAHPLKPVVICARAMRDALHGARPGDTTAIASVATPLPSPSAPSTQQPLLSLAGSTAPTRNMDKVVEVSPWWWWWWWVVGGEW